ncbi:MAG TPA: hypothetical protein PK529_01465 [Verrucomicrobiales bacterium]|nr:hypothetical protein [Nitrospira sp.]HQW27818.1 hypothetical protein [Verrucomicrobiales bacterium]
MYLNLYYPENKPSGHLPVEIMIIKNAGHNRREVGAPIDPGTEEII